MKKILLLGLLVAGIAMAQGNVAEFRIGYDLDNSLKSTSTGVSTDDITKRGIELSAEYRKQITDSFDFGGGISYKYNKLNKKYLEDYETKGFHSVPIYATARYNFRNSSDVTPYIKANLGLALNSGRATLEKNISSYYAKEEFKLGSGLYYGVGAGLTYKNFVADLSYNINAARGKYEKTIVTPFGSSQEIIKETLNHRMLTLSVGYTFGF